MVLKITEMYFLTVLEARSPKSWCRQGSPLSEVSREGPFLVSSSFWWLLAISGIPWLVDASLPLSSLGLSLHVCLCVSFLLVRTSVIWDE